MDAEIAREIEDARERAKKPCTCGGQEVCAEDKYGNPVACSSCISRELVRAVDELEELQRKRRMKDVH